MPHAVAQRSITLSHMSNLVRRGWSAFPIVIRPLRLTIADSATGLTARQCLILP